MTQVLLALAVVVLAAAIGEVVRRRRLADPPTQPRHATPSQLDRGDFDGDGWLVAVFTSDTCSTCADVLRKAEAVQSAAVTVQRVSYQERRDLHQRYAIEAVPIAVVADGDGVVRRAFVGPVTATDLWAAVADAREPGSIDADGCDGHG